MSDQNNQASFNLPTNDPNSVKDKKPIVSDTDNELAAGSNTHVGGDEKDSSSSEEVDEENDEDDDDDDEDDEDDE